MSRDFFLKLDGVTGESTDSKHKNEIDIERFDFGVKQENTSSRGGGGGAGKAEFASVTVEKFVDKSSPVLFQHACTGKPIANAVLTARKSGGEQHEYYQIKLTEVIISHFTTHAADGSNLMESVSLNYSSIQIIYKPQNGDGSLGGAVPGGYDLKAQKPI